MALDYNGQVWGWGINNRGQLGNLKGSEIFDPKPIVKVDSDVLHLPFHNRAGKTLGYTD